MALYEKGSSSEFLHSSCAPQKDRLDQQRKRRPKRIRPTVVNLFVSKTEDKAVVGEMTTHSSLVSELITSKAELDSLHGDIACSSNCTRITTSCGAEKGSVC
ncbi:hypothetical protein KIN20_032129 [Parelaphostrongylus tenuis]|uniref:Uncharacterized protein n=1 Tax=Parelaphostrongylus tenuis TaxID=148309 RepID=A0AAD5R6J1_PARTN|nr:hypothetical protein KIN20_032129 [Parelaphostrongylus tenuis]